MLPELLFNVGSSMQDISRDDFGLLSGGCDKDVHMTRSTSPLSSTLPAASGYHNCAEITPPVSSLSPNLDRVNIKIEESCSDLYGTSSWHHPHHHHADIGSTKLLLKNSDDPLISRGATTVVDDDNPNELNSIVAAAAASNRSLSTIPQSTPKRVRNATGTGTRARRKGTFKLRFHHQALPAEYLSHYEASLNQQNKNVNNNNSKKSNEQCLAKNNSHEVVRSWLQKISDSQSLQSSENQEGHDNSIAEVNSSVPRTPVHRSPKRVINYSDLPYMGEMTLENTKPRRGRKPKKADICHLIFKNYGTIFPGTPKDIVEEETKGLLEKRLSTNLRDLTKTNRSLIEEPLNLCLRDQSTDSLTISSDGEDSEDLIQSNRTTPIMTPSDAVTDALLAANLKMSLPNFQSALLDKNGDENQTPSTGGSDKTSSSNYGYWPSNSGVFIHPMALYYQKMMDTGLPVPITPGTPPVVKKLPSPKIATKNISQMIKKEKNESPEPCSTPSSMKSNSSITTTISALHPNLPQPQKRKRSAIFIPPIPAENTTNPATEVSICKFKFTGGAKPSLQEKKMLSVDSDGNYRYYSGTGDKSMRGYEFFPRESLQQSGILPGVNSAGAFLNATGEKISNDLPPPSVGLSNELLQIPDSPPGSMVLPSAQSSLLKQTKQPRHPSPSSAAQQARDRRKRKSRRSLQREKLEQTFKEKGFLIQTQQLESAEGATYCKFRQLRKFTRYLFRSWKDYLPGELQPANAAVVPAAASANQQTSARNSTIEASASKVSSIEKCRRH